MTDLCDLNDLRLVVDRVDDAVSIPANPIAFLGAGELLADRRPRDSRQASDSGNDSRLNCARLDGLKLRGRRRGVGRAAPAALLCTPTLEFERPREQRPTRAAAGSATMAFSFSSSGCQRTRFL